MGMLNAEAYRMEPKLEAPVSPPAGADRALLSVRVKSIHREADGILAYELVHPEAGRLPAFTAGAHIEIHIRDGLKRQYSLCNAPGERHRYVIAVLKEKTGGGGSKAMHEDVREGDLLTISEPRNHFPLAGREADFHLLLAGGIGVTPMMAMIESLEVTQARWAMHYCTRNLESMAFRARLEPLIAAGKVTLHHDGGDPSQGLDIRSLLSDYEAGTHVYCCGPPGFMSAVKASVGAWPPKSVHFEYFTAAADDSNFVNKPFQIKIKHTGAVLDVPADQTIVDVLRAHGFAIDTDCEDGYCGTCITRYLDGEPEHRDTVLSDVERKNYVMVCCARAKGAPLVLDL